MILVVLVWLMIVILLFLVMVITPFLDDIDMIICRGLLLLFFVCSLDCD